MNKCIAKAGIRHVLTSKRVMDKLGMKLDAEVVLLEDFKEKVTKADKAAGAALAYADARRCSSTASSACTA